MEGGQPEVPSLSLPFQVKSVDGLFKPMKTIVKLGGFVTEPIVSALVELSDNPGPYTFPSENISIPLVDKSEVWSRFFTKPLEFILLDVSADKVTPDNAPVIGTATMSLRALVHEKGSVEGTFPFALTQTYQDMATAALPPAEEGAEKPSIVLPTVTVSVSSSNGKPVGPVEDYNDWNVVDLTVHGAFALPEQITQGLMINDVPSTHQCDYVVRVFDAVSRGGSLRDSPLKLLKDELEVSKKAFDDWAKKNKKAPPKNKDGSIPVVELLPEEVAYNEKVAAINAEIDRLSIGLDLPPAPVAEGEVPPPPKELLVELTDAQKAILKAENASRQVIWTPSTQAGVASKCGKSATSRLYMGRELLRKLRVSLDAAQGCWLYFYPEPQQPVLDVVKGSAPKGGNLPMQKDAFLAHASAVAGRGWVDLSSLVKEGSTTTKISLRIPLERFDPTASKAAADAAAAAEEARPTTAELKKSPSSGQIASKPSSPQGNMPPLDPEAEKRDFLKESGAYVFVTLELHKPLKPLEPITPPEAPLALVRTAQKLPGEASSEAGASVHDDAAEAQQELQSRKTAVSSWRSAVEEGIEAVALEFARQVQSRQLVASHSPDVRAGVIEHLRETGVYGNLEASARNAVLHLVREYVRKNPSAGIPAAAGGLVGEQRDEFYSKLFVYLQRELNHVVNERIRLETSAVEEDVWSANAREAREARFVTAVDPRADPSSIWAEASKQSKLSAESFDEKCVRLAAECEADDDLIKAAVHLSNRVVVEPGRSNPQAHFALARFCARNGRMAAAETALLTAIELFGGVHKCALHLAYMLACVYISRDNFRAARYVLSVIINREPADRRAMLLMAFACFGQAGDERADKERVRYEQLATLEHPDSYAESIPVEDLNDFENGTPLEKEGFKWLELAARPAEAPIDPMDLTPLNDEHQAAVMAAARAPPAEKEKPKKTSDAKDAKAAALAAQAAALAAANSPFIPLDLSALEGPGVFDPKDADALVLSVFDLCLGFGLGRMVIALGEESVVGNVMEDETRTSQRYRLIVTRALMLERNWDAAKESLEASLLANPQEGRHSDHPEAVPLYAETLLRILQRERLLRASAYDGGYETEEEDEDDLMAGLTIAYAPTSGMSAPKLSRGEIDALTDRALAYLERTHKQSASQPDPVSLNRLGALYLQQELWAPARAALLASLHARPTAAGWAGLGFAQLRLGDATEAVNAFLKATVCNPDRPASWLGLALASLHASGIGRTQVINTSRLTDADQALRVAFRLDAELASLKARGPAVNGKKIRSEVSEFIATPDAAAAAAGALKKCTSAEGGLDEDLLLEVARMYLGDEKSSGILAETCAARAIETKESADAHMILGRALARQELLQRATLEMQVAIGSAYEDVALLEQSYRAGLSYAQQLGDNQLVEAVETARELAYQKLEGIRQEKAYRAEQNAMYAQQKQATAMAYPDNLPQEYAEEPQPWN